MTSHDRAYARTESWVSMFTWGTFNYSVQNKADYTEYVLSMFLTQQMPLSPLEWRRLNANGN